MPVSIAEITAHLRRRQQQKRAAAEVRAARLLALLPAAKDLLVGQHGGTSVRLFGSLARGDSGPESDVDLAVLGLPGERYFTALGELMGLFGGPVDLVRLEEAPPSLALRIQDEGRDL